MKLEFHGAAGTVTGSHTILDTGASEIGVDAGMFQGTRMEGLNWSGFGYDVRSLDVLLLTHAHIDHSGRVPLLVKNGFPGPVFSTGATADLFEIMLKDTALLMEEDASRQSDHPDIRSGDESRPPLFTEQDVTEAMKRLRGVGYGEENDISGAKVRFRDAGHILGSAILEVSASSRKFVFSGDLGRPGLPLVRDPEEIQEADFLILESTYGDRDHEGKGQQGAQLTEIIQETVKRGGNLVIPAFAVGRTQDILYELNLYAKAGGLQGMRCFVDSPLATSATEIYLRHPECFDKETNALLAGGDDPLEFPGICFTRTRDESKAINTLQEPHIVISASGMCTGGRILHHLVHNVECHESTILFVGYQAEGTMGRQLKDGAKSIRIMGKSYDVHARIEAVEAFSAHADQLEILDWLKGFEKFPSKVFMNHGEAVATTTLAQKIHEEFGVDVYTPKIGDSFELS
jgi:metallo-beta-lactamase family protein